MISAKSAYGLYSRDLTTMLQRAAIQKTVQNKTKAFEKAFAGVDTLDEFMSNKAVYNYAMKAYGLEDATASKGLIRKILAGGVESGSLASRMTDQRYRDLASEFTFDEDGDATFSASALAHTKTAYYQQILEETAGEANGGARLAVYFERKAASVTSVWGILADEKLLNVVQVALGLPSTMSTLSLDKQAAMITKKLDIEDLRDPKKLAKLLARFTALYDLKETSASENPVVSLLASLRIGSK